MTRCRQTVKKHHAIERRQKPGKMTSYTTFGGGVLFQHHLSEIDELVPYLACPPSNARVQSVFSSP